MGIFHEDMKKEKNYSEAPSIRGRIFPRGGRWHLTRKRGIIDNTRGKKIVYSYSRVLRRRRKKSSVLQRGKRQSPIIGMGS